MLKLKLQYFGHLRQRTDSLEKSDAGKDWRQGEKGVTESWDGITDLRDLSLSTLRELVMDREAWPCFSPWDCKESDTTERLNWSSNLLFWSSLASMLAFICWTIQSQPLYFSRWESRGWKSAPGRLYQGKGRTVMLILNLSHCCFCLAACWLTGQITRLNGMQTLTYRWWSKLRQSWAMGPKCYISWVFSCRCI